MNDKERNRFEFVVQWWVGEHAAKRVTEIFNTIDSMSSAKSLTDGDIGAVVLENWPTWLVEFEKAYNDTPLAKWMFSFSDIHYYKRSYPDRLKSSLVIKSCSRSTKPTWRRRARWPQSRNLNSEIRQPGDRAIGRVLENADTTTRR